MAEKAHSSIVDSYYKTVTGRHRNLPQNILDSIKSSKTKGGAKRILRDHLRAPISK